MKCGSISQAEVLRYVTDKAYRDTMKKSYQARTQAQADADKAKAQSGVRPKEPSTRQQGSPDQGRSATARPSQADPLCDATCQAAKAVKDIMDRVERETGPILGRVNPNFKGEPQLRDNMDKMGGPLNTPGK